MITGNDGVSIALIISIVSLVCTLITTLGGNKKMQREQIESEIERRSSMKGEFTKLNFKLDEFCRRLDELVKKYDTSDERLNDHERRITSLENKVK